MLKESLSSCEKSLREREREGDTWRGRGWGRGRVVFTVHHYAQTTVERHLMPQIQQAVMKFVAHPEQDATLHRQCERFASITLDQLNVKPQLQSSELVPFIDSITQLR